MDYINKLNKLGLERKMIVSALIGKTKADILTINEREYLANYILELERASGNSLDESAALPLHGVSKVKEFICPLCNKLAPITKVIYECECGVKHEAQINDETAVCEHEWTTNEESDIPFALKCIKCGIDG
jgi:hypothetical protein